MKIHSENTAMITGLPKDGALAARAARCGTSGGTNTERIVLWRRLILR
jgi:hypothetical protein